jgi:hypothetical protein
MREVDNDLKKEQGVPTPSESDYRKSNTSILRDHEIRIHFLNRGCIIYVGCKSIAFEDPQLAMHELNKYVNNPYVEQENWRRLLD